MNILSIHSGHDSSACILKNGELVFFFKEERFSRLKRDTIPFISIKKCIENFDEKIDVSIITSVGFDVHSFLYIKKFILSFAKCYDIIDFTNKHHLSHVGTSFYNSGFKEALVLVIDGRGSYYNNQLVECESVFLMSYDGVITPIIKNYFDCPYSKHDNIEQSTIDKLENSAIREVNIFGKLGGITHLYSSICLLIGQQPIDGGKVMGLSSYGEKIKEFPKIFKNKNGEVDEKYFDIYPFSDFWHMPLFKNHYGKITKQITKENYKFYADYAYEIQTQSQEAVGDLIEKSIEKTGVKNICISGGYGMNIVANHYYLQRFPDVNFYFDPIADDTGGSIGAAKIFWHSETGDKTIRPLKNTSFHGVKYDVSKYKGKTTTIKEIATLLYQNKSVAVYTGLAEAGQRALGNRSILFNALNPKAKDIVNEIKKREWYRPFACMVLEEDANNYFEMGKIKSSPFMTMCFPVKSECIELITGVTHVDNTCRIQTVSKEDKHLYPLLKNFKEISGHGILLNTSFNLAGNPLVETPEDAFNTLNNSFLDYLWFEESNQLFSNKNLLNKK